MHSHIHYSKIVLRAGKPSRNLKTMKTFISAIMLLIVFAACKKEDPVEPAPTTDNGTTSNNDTTTNNTGIDTAGYAAVMDTLSFQLDEPVEFFAHGNFVVMIGYIDSNTPATVQNLIDNNPNVTTIILQDVPGSDDDNANLIASRKVRDAGWNTFVPGNALIASGGVDFMIAGVKRDIVSGAQVGVHSWSDGQNDATAFPVGHSNHQPYIDYYVEMGMTQQQSEDFYYFTINAAPASGIHWMTDAEIAQYQLEAQ